MSFIENDEVPAVFFEPRTYRQRVVRCHTDVELAGLELSFPNLVTELHLGVEVDRSEVGSPPAKLFHPVRNG